MSLTRPLTRSITRPITRAITDAGVGGGFSPVSLFASGEQGAWYDPSDLSTMYQDSAGTTAAVVGQPVGRMLDKRLGLARGAEAAVNGDFASGSTGWAGSGATLSVSGGVMRITSTGAGFAGRMQQASTFPTVAGRTYEVTYTRVASNGGAPFVRAGTAVGAAGLYDGAMAPTGAGRFVFVATTSASSVSFLTTPTAGEWVEVDNISVREIPGNHATQATTAFKPLLALTGAVYRRDFDGVDDVMPTTFAASLGSSCTVARSIPGTGAQILTAQTVGTTFNTTVSDCALVIVNRALTAGESASLTTYLNQKAGL